MIGEVGIDNQGLSGIEYAFDPFLKGEPMTWYTQKDALGNPLFRNASTDELSFEPSQNHIRLTLDSRAQFIAEKTLKEWVEKTKSKRGFVGVINPQNGEILALAVEGPPQNWFVTSAYEPGSTFKIFTLAAGLQWGKIDVKETFACPPELRVSPYTIRDPYAVETRYLTPLEIVARSSNIGAVKMGERVESRQFEYFLHQMGFGKQTGLPIGGETNGVLPPAPWTPIQRATISYGHGISVTPLQLAYAYAKIANGGHAIVPQLILRDPPPEAPPILLRQEVIQLLKKALLEVVEHGTGKKARIEGYSIAGKTGTTYKLDENGAYVKTRLISSFVGFLPAENPTLLAITLLDEPSWDHAKDASETAVPLFRELIWALLHLNGSFKEIPVL